jgi:hypothetical protein
VGAAKSGGQEVRVGEMFMECAEKTRFSGFGFFRQGENGSWTKEFKSSQVAGLSKDGAAGVY